MNNIHQYKFSIIVPIYNTEILHHTLKSFDYQTYPKTHFEVIIIDDGSNLKNKLKYKYIVSKFDSIKIVYKYLGNKKGQFRVNYARNLGASLAQYEQLLYIDGDSILPHYYLENFSHIISSNKRGDILVGESIGYNFLDMDPIDSEKIVNKKYDEYLLKPKYKDFRRMGVYEQFWHVFLGGNFYIPKQIFNDIGGWDEDIITWGDEDVEFAFRLYKAGYEFSFHRRIEIYNISTGPRLTPEKFYSALGGQARNYLKHNRDKDYFSYIKQRFLHTQLKYKKNSIPPEFEKELLKNSLFSQNNKINYCFIFIHIEHNQIPLKEYDNYIYEFLNKGISLNFIYSSKISSTDSTYILKLQKKFPFKISLLKHSDYKTYNYDFFGRGTSLKYSHKLNLEKFSDLYNEGTVYLNIDGDNKEVLFSHVKNLISDISHLNFEFLSHEDFIYRFMKLENKKLV